MKERERKKNTHTRARMNRKGGRPVCEEGGNGEYLNYSGFWPSQVSGGYVLWEWEYGSSFREEGGGRRL